VDPISIWDDELATVTWDAENTGNCSIVVSSRGSSGPPVREFIDVDTSGTLDLSLHPTVSSRFQIAAACDDIKARTEITVRPIPAVHLQAESIELVAGESTTLSWFSVDTSSCIAVGDWSGDLLMSGQSEVAPTRTSVYQIGCVSLIDTAAEGARFAVTPEVELVWDEVTVIVIPEPGRLLLQLVVWVAVVALRRARLARFGARGSAHPL
jgi:hypothetical protein